MRALLLTADPLLVAIFSKISQDLGIETESPQDLENVSGLLNRGRYEAVLLDTSTIASAVALIAEIKSSPFTRRAVLFVVTTEFRDSAEALERGARFVVRRPLDPDEIKSIVRSAYNLMSGESRRYFRCKIELPVTVLKSGETFQCFTVNLSGDGMALRTPVPLRLAELIDTQFQLPDGSSFQTRGTVASHDSEGNSEIRFHSCKPEMRQKLYAWMDSLSAVPRSLKS